MSKNTGTSELINYFDLGANGDVGIAGTIYANDGVQLSQVGTALPTNLKNVSGDGIVSFGSNFLGFNGNNNLYFSGNSKGYCEFAFNNAGGGRTYTFPSSSGTIALVGGSGVGTVTSVAALTLGTSGTDLSSTVANGTTTPVITLNVPTASATNRGALSAADWTTFNNKQNALTNPVTGTATAGQVTYWSSGSAITGSSSFLFDASQRNLNIDRSLSTLGNAITISKGSDADQAWLAFKQGGGASGTWRLGYTGDPYDFRINAGSDSSIGTQALRIFLATQNVVIGTGTGDAGFKLDVAGTGRFISSGGYFSIDSNGQVTSTQSLDVATAGGRFTGMSSRGALGAIHIEQTTTGVNGGYMTFRTSDSGSTTPTEKMRITGSIVNVVGNGSQLLFDSLGSTKDGGIQYINDFTLQIFNTRGVGSSIYLGNNNLDFNINVSANPKIRITSGGNVLVGTTDDNGGKFQVSGDIQSSSFIRSNTPKTNSVTIGVSANANYGYIGNDNLWGIRTGTAGDFNIDFNNSTSPINALKISQTGNVGIGVTPAVKFQVNDGTNINLGIKVGQTDSTAVMLNAYNDAVSANIPLEFRASKFAFQNGNVGIGVTPNTWGGTNVKSLEVYLASMSASLTYGTAFTFNTFYDTAGNWKYIGPYTAGRYEIGGDEHIWSNAPGGSAGATATFTQRMKISSSGNVGIGTITPSAWNISVFRGLQIGNNAAAFLLGRTDTTPQMQIGNNAYYDTSWRYVTTSTADRYYQGGGEHVWESAISGAANSVISWATKMMITTSGNLLVGSSFDNGAMLQVNGSIDGATFSSTAGALTVNANTQFKSGFYRWNDTSTNLPEAGFFAVVIYGNCGNVVAQMATHFTNANTYVRSYNNSWTAWRRII